MRLIIALFFLASIMSCKKEQVDVEGKYIDKIERNIISFKDGAQLELSSSDGAKVIFLVRHAEKDTIPAKNPILTDPGYERSYRLAEIFKSTRLDAVYSTLYNRTMHTVDSLVTAKGLATQIYQPKDLKQLGIDILESDTMNAVLIAGHSNTTPAMANVLMGSKIMEEGFDESDYDNFLVVTILADGSKKLFKLKYK